MEVTAMIKSVYEKWEDIKSNSAKDKNYVAKYYLGSKSTANIYFGIADEKMCIYLEFTKEALADLDIPTLKGMTIKVSSEPFINPNKKYLVVKNESRNEEIFEAFSSSITDGLVDATSYFDVYAVFKTVVKEYKDYFANPNKLLSKQEEQGLCAELLELSNLISLKGENVVNNWQGPAKNKRDFVFDEMALEIKSTLSQENTAIRISNENQLDSSYPDNMKELFLKVYIMEDSDNGLNVNKCIDAVLDQIKTISYKTTFLANLMKLKISPTLYKSKYQFTVQKENVYQVLDGFPAITSKTIPHAIYDVSYRLKLDDISKYLIEEGVMNGLL